MRAVVYKEPFRVAVENAPDPAIKHPNDAIPINYDEGDPVKQIKNQRSGNGVDKGIDAVGYQATKAAVRRWL